ncbi:MAG TPA: cobalamin-independent methionine synthase II family protein [Xanthobacteraceae bacterium]|nr:cobalamin-independent methionine synthase II family protein [Xanthobacteraceae bacterium]
MKRSTDRILVSHVGSLVRPMSIRNILSARDYGEPHDEASYGKILREEVAAVVKKQAEIGIDIVSDGEYGKAGWIRYVAERLGGFVHRPFRAGDKEHNPVYLIREAKKFADFYAAYTPIQFYDWLPPGQTKTGLKMDVENQRKNLLIWECVAPITYKGQEAINQDIGNFKAALKDVKAEGFMPVAAPMSARGLWLNAYYKKDEEIVVALADALKEEYKAIVDAGFILQLDDAFLAHEYDRLQDEMDAREVHKYAEHVIELTNYALSGIPEDKVRYHVCWGSWNAPHTTDVPLRTLADLILKVKAQAYSLEGANPRHEHEWMVWKDIKLPDGKILLPGMVTHSTNVVEHPELVAWRIKNYASVVGRENIIASTDCGFSQSYNIVRCHPSVQWAKLEALTEGARLASKELWGR